jgi:pilus assembly protein FimV
LAKNPQRQDAKLKLLEIYAARKDKDAFNRLANDVRGQTHGVGDTWINVAAMGYALDPANSIYAEGKHAAAPAPVAPASDLDFDLGAQQTTGATTDIVLDSGGATTMEVRRPDATAVLEPGDLQRMVSTSEFGARPQLVPDFTLEPPSDPVTETDIHIEETVATQDSHMIDFQIELPKADTSLEKTLILETPPDTDSGVDFKLDIPDLNLGESPTVDVTAGGGEKDGHWYDVQSKFDLAKAYQEMGDKDGAKDILQEVIKEGDAEQQAQAKKLLETIS